MTPHELHTLTLLAKRITLAVNLLTDVSQRLNDINNYLVTMLEKNLDNLPITTKQKNPSTDETPNP